MNNCVVILPLVTWNVICGCVTTVAKNAPLRVVGREALTHAHGCKEIQHKIIDQTWVCHWRTDRVSSGVGKKTCASTCVHGEDPHDQC